MQGIDASRAFELLERLSFVRPSGSAAEARAAELIAAELSHSGLEPATPTFPVWTFDEKPSFAEVVAPYLERITASPAGLSGTTGPGGISGELVFIETGEEEFVADIEGKVALMYEFPSVKIWERLTRAKASALVVIGDIGEDLLHLSVEHCWQRFGPLPTVCIRYEDGLRLLKSGAREVRIVCDQDEHEAESRNVVTEIRGTEKPDEVVVLCGHYDTVPGSVGAHDNGGGSVILLELARLFAANPARRTLRLIWFGSEELGLCGSFAYVSGLSETERERIKLVVNIDVAGGVIGRNRCTVTGNDALKAYVEALGKEAGIGLSVHAGVMGSDGTPFSDKGIPSINLARRGGATARMHTSGDALEHTDGAHLAMLGDFAGTFVSRVANARVFPFDRDIPDAIRNEITKYKEESLGFEKEKK